MTSTAPIPLSTKIRERSQAAHSDSEGSGFMASLLKGQRSRDDYVALVAQHYFIYRALEAATDRMRPRSGRIDVHQRPAHPAAGVRGRSGVPDRAHWREQIAPRDRALRRAHRAGRLRLGRRLRRAPLHPLPRRPVRRHPHRQGHPAPVRLRHRRLGVLRLRRHRRPRRVQERVPRAARRRPVERGRARARDRRGAARLPLQHRGVRAAQH